VGSGLEEEEGIGGSVGKSEDEEVGVAGSDAELDGDSELLGSVGVAEGFRSRAASFSTMRKITSGN
jgi:hypothetical protein